MFLTLFPKNHPRWKTHDLGFAFIRAWRAPVALDELLPALIKVIRRYVRLSEHDALVVADQF